MADRSIFGDYNIPKEVEKYKRMSAEEQSAYLSSLKPPIAKAIVNRLTQEVLGRAAIKSQLEKEAKENSN